MAEYVTHRELGEAISGLAADLKAQIDALGARFDQVHRGAGETSFRLLGYGLVLASMLAGLSWFAIERAADPLSVKQGEIGRQVDALSAHRLQVVETLGRYSVIEELLINDLAIAHGGGKDQAVLDSALDRQRQIWDKTETLELQINRINERLAVILDQKE